MLTTIISNSIGKTSTICTSTAKTVSILLQCMESLSVCFTNIAIGGHWRHVPPKKPIQLLKIVPKMHQNTSFFTHKKSENFLDRGLPHPLTPSPDGEGTPLRILHRQVPPLRPDLATPLVCHTPLASSVLQGHGPRLAFESLGTRYVRPHLAPHLFPRVVWESKGVRWLGTGEELHAAECTLP